MGYITQTDLENRFGSDELLALADRDGDDVIDATVIAQAIQDAESVIDSYVARRYDLPLSTVPPILVSIACDLARFNLYTDDPLEAVKNRRDDAVRYLRDIADGRIELQGQSVEEPAASDDGLQVIGPDRMFSDDSMAGF